MPGRRGNAEVFAGAVHRHDARPGAGELAATDPHAGPRRRNPPPAALAVRPARKHPRREARRSGALRRRGGARRRSTPRPSRRRSSARSPGWSSRATRSSRLPTPPTRGCCWRSRIRRRCSTAAGASSCSAGRRSPWSAAATPPRRARATRSSSPQLSAPPGSPSSRASRWASMPPRIAAGSPARLDHRGAGHRRRRRLSAAKRGAGGADRRTRPAAVGVPAWHQGVRAQLSRAATA